MREYGRPRAAVRVHGLDHQFHRYLVQQLCGQGRELCLCQRKRGLYFTLLLMEYRQGMTPTTIPAPVRWRRHLMAVLLGTAVLLGLVVPALAQEAGAPDAYPLEFAAWDEEPGGSVAAMQGTTGPEGLTFSLSKLTIMQPVSVVVATVDGGQLDVELTKLPFGTVEETATTDADGMAALYVRTEGAMGIRVSSEAETAFELLVWVGDPVEPELGQQVVTSYDESRTPGGGADGNEQDAPAAEDAGAEVASPAAPLSLPVLLGLVAVVGFAGVLAGAVLMRRVGR